MAKKKILVVDDDHSILDVIQLILEQNTDCEVLTTDQGESLLGLQSDFPDLILLDIWMSGTDGRDICKHLKSRERTRNIPIIFISANANLEGIAKATGADDYLSKPFNIVDLLDKVANWLE